MDVMLVIGMCCFFMEDKTWCLLMAYFLLLFQLIIVEQALLLWITKESVLNMLEVDTIDSWWKFFFLIMSIGLALAVSIAAISFMVALLVDLYNDNTWLTENVLTFSTIILTVTVLFFFVSEYAFDINSIMAEHRILLLVYAFFPYMMSNYWVNLRENSELYEDA